MKKILALVMVVSFVIGLLMGVGIMKYQATQDAKAEAERVELETRSRIAAAEKAALAKAEEARLEEYNSRWYVRSWNWTKTAASDVADWVVFWN